MTYWQKRYDQIEQAAHDKSVAYYSALDKKYSRAQAEIDKEINAWYQRFAVNNKIDYTEARRLLNSDELDEFRWSVEDYIKAGEQNDVDGRWMKELENASARHHVNRLEALKLSTTNSIEKAMGGMTDDVDKMLRDVYKSTYYKGCYEFQRGTGIGFDLAKVNDRYLDAILKKPWCADGSNFSDKIWKNKTKLVNELDNELTRMALTGDAPGESIRRISKALHTSKNNAATLVMTEQAFFTSIAQQDAFKELGVGEFEVVATLDGLTCTTCGSHDGEHRPMSEFKPGITAPPYHPNCRCTTVPYFNDEFTTAGKRAGRDEEGKTYYVPESTKYAEWKQAFVHENTKVNHYHTHVDNESRHDIIDLSIEEKAALLNYKSFDSYKINEALRNTKNLSELPLEKRQIINNLDAALLKMPKYEGNLIRTVDFSDWADSEQRVKQFLREYVPGEVITVNQYWSASKDEGYNDNAKINIYINDTKNGRDISHIGLNENEVLYERNSKFYVVLKEFADDAWYIFLMEAD